METPETMAGELTERIMARLRAAGVLRPDEPGRPHTYNAAYSAVLGVLEGAGLPRPAALASAEAKRLTGVVADALLTALPRSKNDPRQRNRR
jgi:hypothetical protein